MERENRKRVVIEEPESAQMSVSGVCFLLSGVIIAVSMFCAVVQKCEPQPANAGVWGEVITTGAEISIEEAVIKAQAYEIFQAKHGAAWKEAEQVKK